MRRNTVPDGSIWRIGCRCEAGQKKGSSYQIDEIRFVLSRLFQAMEREIVVSYADSPATELRCYMRDPYAYRIEVGQTTMPPRASRPVRIEMEQLLCGGLSLQEIPESVMPGIREPGRHGDMHLGASIRGAGQG